MVMVNNNITSNFVAKTEACWIFSDVREKEKATTKHFHEQNKQKLKPTLFIFNEKKISKSFSFGLYFTTLQPQNRIL